MAEGEDVELYRSTLGDRPVPKPRFGVRGAAQATQRTIPSRTLSEPDDGMTGTPPSPHDFLTSSMPARMLAGQPLGENIYGEGPGVVGPSNLPVGVGGHVGLGTAYGSSGTGRFGRQAIPPANAYTHQLPPFHEVPPAGHYMSQAGIDGPQRPTDLRGVPSADQPFNPAAQRRSPGIPAVTGAGANSTVYSTPSRAGTADLHWLEASDEQQRLQKFLSSREVCVAEREHELKVEREAIATERNKLTSDQRAFSEREKSLRQQEEALEARLRDVEVRESKMHQLERSVGAKQ